MEAVGFGIVTACCLLGALLVATARNLVHGVLWLGMTLATTAVLFVMLRAPFVAGIQVLLYAGGVMTLMIFGVMLTRRHGEDDAGEAHAERTPQPHRVRGAIVAATLFGTVAGAIGRTPGLPDATPEPTQAADIGRALLGEHLLSFEIASLLLLAAMVGAVVLARRRDHGAPASPAPAGGARLRGKEVEAE